MYNRLRINTYRFSADLCTVANTYGYKTIGSFTKALQRALPSTKWQCGTKYIRGTKLLKELKFLNIR